MTNTTEKPSPYRIEWRHSMVGVWTLAEEADDHDAAIVRADEIVEQLDGFSRVIVQHVIHSARAPLTRPSPRQRRRARAA